ncbi:MAG: hypothetical protein RLY87_650 [Chloroflexota bacterium]
MELARHWRQRNARYRLEGTRHTSTGAVAFPAVHGTDWEPWTLSGRGSVLTFAVVHQASTGHDGDSPYIVAIVQLVEGPRITAQLTDVSAHEVVIGMQVEMVTRLMGDTGPDGLLLYAYKFRPVL